MTGDKSLISEKLTYVSYLDIILSSPETRVRGREGKVGFTQVEFESGRSVMY